MLERDQDLCTDGLWSMTVFMWLWTVFVHVKNMFSFMFLYPLHKLKKETTLSFLSNV